MKECRVSVMGFRKCYDFVLKAACVQVLSFPNFTYATLKSIKEQLESSLSSHSNYPASQIVLRSKAVEFTALSSIKCIKLCCHFSPFHSDKYCAEFFCMKCISYFVPTFRKVASHHHHIIFSSVTAATVITTTTTTTRKGC